MAKASGRKQQKLTSKQRQARIDAAKERTKKIFTIVVCVILVLALGIPTMALAVLSA